MSARMQLVLVGAAWALAVALPAALIAQLADALTSGDRTPPIAYPCAVLVLLATGAGGWTVGRARPPRATTLGALAGLLAIAVVQLLGLLRAVAAGDHVAWGAVPAVVALGAALGATGAGLGLRWPGRTRP